MTATPQQIHALVQVIRKVLQKPCQSLSDINRLDRLDWGSISTLAELKNSVCNSGNFVIRRLAIPCSTVTRKLSSSAKKPMSGHHLPRLWHWETPSLFLLFKLIRRVCLRRQFTAGYANVYLTCPSCFRSGCFFNSFFVQSSKTL